MLSVPKRANDAMHVSMLEGNTARNEWDGEMSDINRRDVAVFTVKQLDVKNWCS